MFWTKHWIETIKECIESLRDWVEALHNKQNEQQKQIDLILKELGKEYVPEKSVTEPAKLVDKEEFNLPLIKVMAAIDAFETSKETRSRLPKKKRGRPKKK